jgi:hypothetical protein
MRSDCNASHRKLTWPGDHAIVRVSIDCAVLFSNGAAAGRGRLLFAGSSPSTTWSQLVTSTSKKNDADIPQGLHIGDDRQSTIGSRRSAVDDRQLMIGNQ